MSQERLVGLALLCRALTLGAVSFKSVQSILKTGLDRQPLAQASAQPSVPIDHPNIRGGDYYH